MKAGVISEPKQISDYSRTIIVGDEGVVDKAEDIKTLEDEVKRLLISRRCLLKRIDEMAEEIVSDYKGEKIYAVIILEGATRFFRKLTSAIGKEKPIISYLIKLQSYDKDKSSGKVNMLRDLAESVEGKDVLIIEDIVDTGLTLNFLIDYLLNEKKAKSVKVCSLLNKQAKRLPEYKRLRIDYLGFEIPNKFVVGIGLDHDGEGRGLHQIYALIDSSAH